MMSTTVAVLAGTEQPDIWERYDAMEAERDAALAQVAVLREALANTDRELRMCDREHHADLELCANVQEMADENGRLLADTAQSAAAFLAGERERAVAAFLAGPATRERLTRAANLRITQQVEEYGWRDVDSQAVLVALAASEPKEGQRCDCRADAELGAGAVCPSCGHRDHGRSGCGAPR